MTSADRDSPGSRPIRKRQASARPPVLVNDFLTEVTGNTKGPRSQPPCDLCDPCESPPLQFHQSQPKAGDMDMASDALIRSRRPCIRPRLPQNAVRDALHAIP